jgi:hypothetical protein
MDGGLFRLAALPFVTVGYMVRATFFGDSRPYDLAGDLKKHDKTETFREAKKRKEKEKMEELKNKQGPHQENEKTAEAIRKVSEKTEPERKPAEKPLGRVIEPKSEMLRQYVKETLDAETRRDGTREMQNLANQVNLRTIVVREGDNIPLDLQKAGNEMGKKIADIARMRAELKKLENAARNRSQRFRSDPPASRKEHMEFLDEAAQIAGVAEHIRQGIEKEGEELTEKYGNPSIEKSASALISAGTRLDELVVSAAISANEMFREMEERADGRTRDEVLMAKEKVPHLENVRYLDAGRTSTFYDKVEITTQPGATIYIPAGAIDNLPLAMATASKFIEKVDRNSPKGYENYTTGQPYRSLGFIAGNEDIEKTAELMESQMQKQIYDRHRDRELAKSISIDEMKKEIFSEGQEKTPEKTEPEKADPLTELMNAYALSEEQQRKGTEQMGYGQQSQNMPDVSRSHEQEHDISYGSDSSYITYDDYGNPYEHPMTPEEEESLDRAYDEANARAMADETAMMQDFGDGYGDAGAYAGEYDHRGFDRSFMEQEDSDRGFDRSFMEQEDSDRGFDRSFMEQEDSDRGFDRSFMGQEDSDRGFDRSFAERDLSEANQTPVMSLDDFER